MISGVASLVCLFTLAFAWGYRRGKRSGFSHGFARGVIVTTDSFARGFRAAEEYLGEIGEETAAETAEGKPN